MQRYGANHTVAKAGWLKRVASFICHNHHRSEGLIHPKMISTCNNKQMGAAPSHFDYRFYPSSIRVAPENKERKNHPFRTAKLILLSVSPKDKK